MQPGTGGGGVCFKRAPDGGGEPELAGMVAPGLDGMLTSPSLQASGMGRMSVLVDTGRQAARHAGSIPCPGMPCTIPSACMGLLTGSDSCDSTPAPVAGEMREKQGRKECNYLLTRFHIFLLSERFCFLIYFDLPEN